jgi:hypothetical protein
MLNVRDVTPLPPYKNLVPRFRGEENPRSKNQCRRLDFEQELNAKDIEDFLLFPMVIHEPSCDQWRYVLSKLTNAAGSLRWTDLEEINYFEF